MPDLMARRGIEQFDRHAGGLTAEQRRAVDTWLPGLAALGDSGEAAAGGSPEADSGGGPAISGMVRVKAQPVLGREQDTSMVSFFAAGIAVMFLLFSCANSAGALLEEIESGTLDRLLSSRLGMTGLLTGKFVYLTLMGVSQLTVMFLYAAFVFRLDLFDHLPGFAAMTLATAATCAAFGLLLATLCRTRQQLGGISTLVILMLSALGGSMFPRFLMSEGMQKAGRATFNAWALDGYTDVFWRNAGIAGILPEVGVLLAFMTAFLVAARMAARRWEQV
jgi:ABC-2 type transport system permease protein